MSLVKLAIGLGATGVFLLIFHAVYRLLLACRACCCKKKCCTCVEKNTKGKGTRYRLVMWCLIGGVVVSLCTYTYGQTTLLEGVDALNDAIDKIVALIDNLQDIVKDMTQATAHMSNALASVSCVGGYESEYEDYVDQISEVNATVSDVNANFKDMRKPVDTIQDRVASHGKTYVAAIVPLVVATPFSLYVILTVLGLLAELVHSAATRFCGSCCLNAGACWAGGPGLGLALLVFVVLCVFSIALADFCWLGPASVLTGDNDDNQYLAYFLQCVGENPLESDVNTMSDAVDDLYDATSELSGYTSYPSRRRNLLARSPISAVAASADDPRRVAAGDPPRNRAPTRRYCSNLDDAIDSLDGGVAELQSAADTITDEVLVCDSIQPILEDIFYTGICDKTVSGIYRVWATIAAAWLFTYAGILILPFVTASIRQELRGNQPLVGPDSKFAKISPSYSGARPLYAARKENASQHLGVAQARRARSRRETRRRAKR